MLDSDMLYSLVPRPRVTAAAGGLHQCTRTGYETNRWCSVLIWLEFGMRRGSS